jgi:hypothetical protein
MLRRHEPELLAGAQLVRNEPIAVDWKIRTDAVESWRPRETAVERERPDDASREKAYGVGIVIGSN